MSLELVLPRRQNNQDTYRLEDLTPVFFDQRGNRFILVGPDNSQELLFSRLRLDLEQLDTILLRFILLRLRLVSIRSLRLQRLVMPPDRSLRYRNLRVELLVKTIYDVPEELEGIGPWDTEHIKVPHVGAEERIDLLPFRASLDLT